MGHTWLRAAALAFVLTLCACGGGSSSRGGGGGMGANQPPNFTSAPNINVAENTTGVVYIATATDPEGNAITFSLAGGLDGALFQITPGGQLSFRNPPDFEAPGDANADNVYEVPLQASDGQANTGFTLRIVVANASGSGTFVVRRVGTGFNAPIFIAALPDGSGRMIVVERAGRIVLLDPTTGTIGGTPMLDITGQVSTDGERGLLGLALAPDFMTSGRAYLYMTALDGSIQLRRYTSTGSNRAVLDPATADVLLSIPHSQFNNHNGGWLGFGRDGLLYMATGDGGGANDPLQNGQNRSTLLAKMLRLDVTRDDFPGDPNRDYGIPPANPFATSGGAPEVWLYGLRNPFRASFDRSSGDLFIGDVGQGAVEEVDRVQITQSGLNMGWPLYEGSQPLLGSNPGITMPVTEYFHGSGPLQGNSITGGVVYHGPVEQLQGLYVFADFISGNIWTVPSANLTQGTTTPSSAFTNRNAAFTPNIGSLTSVVGFGEDAAGNVYIVSIAGSIFAILPGP